MNVFPFKVDANLVPAILQTRTLSLMLLNLCSLSCVAIDGATFSRLELRMNYCVSWDKQFSSGTEVCFWCPNVSFIQKQTFYVISKHYLLISAFSSLTLLWWGSQFVPIMLSSLSLLPSLTFLFCAARKVQSVTHCRRLANLLSFFPIWCVRRRWCI